MNKPPVSFPQMLNATVLIKIVYSTIKQFFIKCYKLSLDLF